MIEFRFREEPACKKCRCRHMLSSVMKKDKGTDIHTIRCSFNASQAGHARVPKWCPEYAYLHDGKERSADG